MRPKFGIEIGAHIDIGTGYIEEEEHKPVGDFKVHVGNKLGYNYCYKKEYNS